MDTRRWLWGLSLMLCASVSPLQAETSIFRCTVDGVATFTDRPCYEGAAPIELDASHVSTFTPVPAGKVQLPKSPRSKSRRADPPDKTKERCVSLRSSLRKIDDQLRSGYSAQQGVKLDARKRDLRRQARELRC